MACSCCGVGSTVEQHFSPSKAAKDWQRYRQKGIRPTTRLLRDGLANAGLIKGVLLDIGAGIGALTFELLDRGVSHAVIVEASSAYAEGGRAQAPFGPSSIPHGECSRARPAGFFRGARQDRVQSG